MTLSFNLRSRNALRAALMATALTGAVSGLAGCVPLVVGGAAAGTASVITDRRSSGTQLDDQTMAFAAQHNVSNALGDGDDIRVRATAYDGKVLLTGDVPNDAAKSKAGTTARQVEKVKSVVNELTVGPVASLGDRSNDTWLSSKVRTALLDTKYVPSGTINTTVEHGVVYLMGKVTEEEGNYAATAVAGVGGVAKVVKLFTYISREEAVRLSGNTTTSAPENAGKPAANSAPIVNSGDNGGSGTDTMQAMPIQ